MSELWGGTVLNDGGVHFLQSRAEQKGREGGRIEFTTYGFGLQYVQWKTCDEPSSLTVSVGQVICRTWLSLQILQARRRPEMGKKMPEQIVREDRFRISLSSFFFAENERERRGRGEYDDRFDARTCGLALGQISSSCLPRKSATACV